MDLPIGPRSIIRELDGPAQRQHQTGTDGLHRLGKVLRPVEPHPNQKPVSKRLNAGDAIDVNVHHLLRLGEFKQVRSSTHDCPPHQLRRESSIAAPMWQGVATNFVTALSERHTLEGEARIGCTGEMTDRSGP